MKAPALDPALDDLLRALATGGPFDEADAAVLLAAPDAAPAGAIAFALGALAARARPHDGAALAAACRAAQPQVPVRGGPGAPTIDLVGTGGGRATFNITTTAAFVVAAAGGRVVKSGSVAFSSRSGALETAAVLGVLRDVPLDELADVVRAVGIAIVPPQRYAPALAALARAVAPAPWKRLGGFVNSLGPLLSPVAVDHRVWGASAPALEERLLVTARRLGDLPATIVRGEEGIDEASTIGRTAITRCDADGDERTWLDPASLGVDAVTWDDLAGADPPGAARLVTRVLSGRGTPAQSQIVALNAAVALRAAGLADDVPRGYARALELLRAGAGAGVLASLRAALRPSG